IQKGYVRADARLAESVVVAFLDESALSSPNAAFKSWVGRPLHHEIFGRGQYAGERTFTEIEELLGRTDSPELADVLEVYGLCLYLGYQGQHGTSGKTGLRTTAELLAKRIERIRGPAGELSPDWRVPNQVIPKSPEPFT